MRDIGRYENRTGFFDGFLRAAVGQWFSTMSGGLSVPLAVLSYFVTNDYAKLILLITAIACFFAAAYQVWRIERTRAVHSEQGLAPKLSLIFNPDDARCVRDKLSFHNYLEARIWSIGLENVSLTTSADDVTVFVRESWFVSCTVAVAHRRRDQPDENEPVIYKTDALHPGAREFIELFGLAPDMAERGGDVFKRSHEFTIEARARDTPIAKMTLRYEPTNPPRLGKIS